MRFGFASSRSGAFTNVEKTTSAANTISSAMNSSISRCGHTLTRSPCSRSTRWMPSGGTSASSRCFSSAPFFGVGHVPGRAAAPGAPGRWRPAPPAGAAAGAAAAAAQEPPPRRARQPPLRQPVRRAARSCRGLLGVRPCGRRARPPTAPGPRRPAGRSPWRARPRACCRSLLGRAACLRAPCPSSLSSTTAVRRSRRPCGSSRSARPGRSPGRTAARARAARTSAAASAARRPRRPAAGSSPASR